MLHQIGIRDIVFTQNCIIIALNYKTTINGNRLMKMLETEFLELHIEPKVKKRKQLLLKPVNDHFNPMDRL